MKKQSKKQDNEANVAAVVPQAKQEFGSPMNGAAKKVKAKVKARC